MNLPIINPQNSKQDKKMPYRSSIQEFGLGIQVFKIQSNKCIEDDRSKYRKFITNIENPVISKPSFFTAKKNQKLPSLSSEKYTKTGMDDSTQERKVNKQRKRQVVISDSIKQFEQKRRPIEKKSSSAQQPLKNVIPQTIPQILQKQIIHRHFCSTMNDLKQFYQAFDQRQAQNMRLIKKLKKTKQNGNEQLTKQLKMRQNKTEMAIDIANRQDFCSFSQSNEYQEFDITRYTQGRFKFKYFDQQQQREY